MSADRVSPSQRADEVVRRRAARVLVVDPGGHVLMIQGFDPHRPEDAYWYTVGGGLEPGETHLEAAVREVWEETGAVITADDLVGPVHHDRGSFSFEGRTIHQEQVFYGWVTDRFDADPAGFEELESRSTIRVGWIDPATCRAGGEAVYPAVLERLVEVVLETATSSRPPSTRS
ncbi:NUDIX domain-containing protein [Pedococcus sp. KACC 23699]|uniref:NUDIX domain-containing protein n=1 Tax=Pedococcus sp. KACC 23699 TaxID=3149228 RepID=A0AAU7JS58_9MICO